MVQKREIHRAFSSLLALPLECLVFKHLCKLKIQTLSKPNAKRAGEEFFPEAFATHISKKLKCFCMKRERVHATATVLRRCSSRQTSGAENFKREKM